jgi:hypothetical protein
MTLTRTAWIALVLLLPALPGFAQNWISVGVKAGVPLTDAFADRTFNFTAARIQTPFGLPPTIEEETFRTYSGSRNFLIGPTLELQLPLGLSVETDALYRRLSVNILETTSLSGFANFLLDTVALSSRINSWEFPVLAKYRLPFPVVKPYLEAGRVFAWPRNICPVPESPRALESRGNCGAFELRRKSVTRIGVEMAATTLRSTMPYPIQTK